MTRGRALSKKLLAALLCLSAVGLSAGVAAAAEPDSMSEARAMGDPAADAPVLPTPGVITYKGEEIDEATSVKLGLACMQTAALQLMASPCAMPAIADAAAFAAKSRL